MSIKSERKARILAEKSANGPKKPIKKAFRVLALFNNTQPMSNKTHNIVMDSGEVLNLAYEYRWLHDVSDDFNTFDEAWHYAIDAYDALNYANANGGVSKVFVYDVHNKGIVEVEFYIHEYTEQERLAKCKELGINIGKMMALRTRMSEILSFPTIQLIHRNEPGAPEGYQPHYGQQVGALN